MATFITSIAIAIIFLFNNISVLANSINNEINPEINNLKGETSLNEKKMPTKGNISDEDIFGDEQTFPFIAGLGKNAAH